MAPEENSSTVAGSQESRGRRVARIGLDLLVWAEWIWLIAVGCLLALNGVFEPVPVWLVIPVTFRFYWFLPMAPVAGLALLMRKPKRHLPSILGMVIFVWLYGAQFMPRFPADDSAALRVMTYNVQRGYQGTDLVLGVIKGVQPDVLALQESGCRKTDGQDLISRLEHDQGFTCNFRSYYEHATSAGVALCVQAPLVVSNVQRRTYHVKGRWSFLFAEMDYGGRTVNLVVPHLVAFGISDTVPKRDYRRIWNRLNSASRWHHSETAELQRLVSTFDDPTIMAGDFNSTPGQKIHDRIRKTMTDAFREKGWGLGSTFAFGLPIRIDYIYLSREFETLAARAGPSGPSDHRPVIATVRLGK